MTQVSGWDAAAIRLWDDGQREAAIQRVLACINVDSGAKPPQLILQLVYYAFLSGDVNGAAIICEQGLREHPDHRELLRNAAALRSRTGAYAAAIAHLDRYLLKWPDDYNAYDTLCAARAGLGEYQAAAAAGKRALELKDRSLGEAPAWRLPTRAEVAEGAGGAKVIAFSLFGKNARYLRGALDNALTAPHVYPEWRLRFYVDSSVPAEVQAALVELDCEVVLEPDNQPLRRKLCWRFQVANDASVGRFLVRDVDSLINQREAAAVNQWLASGRLFHIMRDWWTHTDLILAGMWGGVGGVLPNVIALLDEWRSPSAETPNVDQIFLRDKIWPLIRGSTLVHDRCFTAFDALPWPGPQPEGCDHVGENEIAVRQHSQALRLRRWLQRLPSLAIG